MLSQIYEQIPTLACLRMFLRLSCTLLDVRWRVSYVVAVWYSVATEMPATSRKWDVAPFLPALLAFAVGGCITSIPGQHRIRLRLKNGLKHARYALSCCYHSSSLVMTSAAFSSVDDQKSKSFVLIATNEVIGTFLRFPEVTASYFWADDVTAVDSSITRLCWIVKLLPGSATRVQRTLFMRRRKVFFWMMHVSQYCRQRKWGQ